MDVQEAVAESTPIEAAQDPKRDGQRKFTMGPNDSLEGKLTYDGSVHVDGRAEGEFRVTGNIEVASGATVKALLEASNVTTSKAPPTSATSSSSAKGQSWPATSPRAGSRSRTAPA
jgi:hypothetical protein